MARGKGEKEGEAVGCRGKGGCKGQGGKRGRGR